SRTSRSATRTASTAGFGTRAFFGSIRSIQTQQMPLDLPFTWTENAKRSVDSTTPGSESAILRTSEGFMPAMLRMSGLRIKRGPFRSRGSPARPKTRPAVYHSPSCGAWRGPRMSRDQNLLVAQSTVLKPIDEIAAKLSLGPDELEHYGRYKAKIS